MVSLSGHSVYHLDVLTVWFCLLAVSQAAYVNVAFNKPAYLQYPVPGDQYDASNAVDGRKSNLSLNGDQCAISYNSLTATWWVNLTSIHSIHHITIYFITENDLQVFYGELSDYFLGFSVYVSNTTERLQGTLCYKDDNFTRDTIPAVFTTTCPVHGQYVIYYNERRQGVTYPYGYYTSVNSDLCEVEVYGCPRGFYGTNCSIACPDTNCYCHIENGTCQICKPGYQGYLCKLACDEGSFGDNCSETCGHCRDINKCSNINGTCFTECDAGYQGELCKKQCDRGSYGIDCNETCGHCRDVNQCFHTNGTCFTGCITGFQGDLCKTPCQRGFFGENCINKCLKYCAGCNDVTGMCEYGCIEGYTGYFCENACPYGLFGQNCTGECNDNCTGCNNVNGVCDRGCHPGWRGDYCEIVLDQYYLQSIGQLTRQTYTLSLVIGVVYTTGYEAETEGITWFHKAWGNLIETSNTSVVMTV